jgi:hypothetical protein
VLDEVALAFTGAGGNDPVALATALQEAAGDVRAIDPPAEIEQDWTALADRIDQAFAGVDLKDPAAAAEVQQRTGELIGSLSTSTTNVQNYLSQECGIGPTATAPAAPTT